jgi:hypothetical protein
MDAEVEEEMVVLSEVSEVEKEVCPTEEEEQEESVTSL